MRGTMVVVVAVGAIGCLLASVPSARANGDEEDALIRHAIQLRKHGDDRAAPPSSARVRDRAQPARRRAARVRRAGARDVARGRGARPRGAGGPERPVDSQAPCDRRGVARDDSIPRRARRRSRAGSRARRSASMASRSARCRCATPCRSAPGPVDIEVRGAGFAPSLKTVKVAAGEYARVPFTLAAGRAAAGARTAPAGPAARRRRAQAPPRSRPSPAAPPCRAARAERRADDGRGRRIAGIGLVAGGVAAIGGGVAASVVAKNKFDAINADAAADRPYNESNGNWKTYETAAAALYVVGGAARHRGRVSCTSAGVRRAEARRPPAVGSVSLAARCSRPAAPAPAVSVRF